MEVLRYIINPTASEVVIPDGWTEWISTKANPDQQVRLLAIGGTKKAEQAMLTCCETQPGLCDVLSVYTASKEGDGAKEALSAIAFRCTPRFRLVRIPVANDHPIVDLFPAAFVEHDDGYKAFFPDVSPIQQKVAEQQKNADAYALIPLPLPFGKEQAQTKVHLRVSTGFNADAIHEVSAVFNRLSVLSSPNPIVLPYYVRYESGGVVSQQWPLFDVEGDAATRTEQVVQCVRTMIRSNIVPPVFFEDSFVYFSDATRWGFLNLDRCVTFDASLNERVRKDKTLESWLSVFDTLTNSFTKTSVVAELSKQAARYKDVLPFWESYVEARSL